MEQLPSTAVLPPAPKQVAPVAPVVEPTPSLTPTITPVAEPKPRRENDGPKPGEKGYETFEQRIGRRVKEAEAAADTDKAAAAKAIADKAEADRVAAAAEKPAVDGDVSDEQLEQEIVTEIKGLDPKQGKAWGDLRRSERALKRAAKDAVPAAKLTELETQLAEARQQLEATKTATPADPAEVAALKSENEKLTKRDQERESELMIAKVERTEAYANAVTKPLEKVEAAVARIAKKIDVPADKLMTALKDTSDNQSDLLVEAVTGMNEVDKMTFLGLVSKVTEANEKAAVLRANAKEALEKVSAKSSTEMEAQARVAKEARQAAHTSNWEKLKTELSDVLTPVQGDDDVTKAWNKAQADAEAFARDTDFSALKPEVQSQFQQRAAVFPLLMGKLQALEVQVAAVIAEKEAALVRLEKFEAGTPPNAADRSSESDATKKGPTDFVQRINARFEAVGR